jgi:PAS domain S-box-containing protein
MRNEDRDRFSLLALGQQSVREQLQTGTDRSNQEVEWFAAEEIDAACEILAGQEIDCLLVDTKSKAHDVGEVRERVRADHPSVPMLLVGAGADEALVGEQAASEVVESVSRAQVVEQLVSLSDELRWMVTADWSETVYVTDTYEALFDHSVAAIVDEPMTVLSTVHPEDRDAVSRAMERASSGESPSIEFRVRTDEGDWRWIHADAKPITDGQGTVTRIAGFCRDVTRRKESERAVERARKRYRTLIRTAPDPIFVLDAATLEIVELNEAAERLCDEPAEALTGRSILEFSDPEKRPESKRLFERIGDGETVSRYPDGSQLYFCPETGHRRPVEISGGRIEIEGVELVYGIVRDITERRRHERTLTELYRSSEALQTAGEAQAVADQIVATATEILEFPLVSVYEFDETEGVLRPIASDRVDGTETTTASRLPTLPLEDSLAGRAYADGDTKERTDGADADDPLPGGAALGTELIVPLGEWGVFVAASDQAGSFDSTDRQLAELLALTATTALERVERTREFEDRTQALDSSTRRLDRIEAAIETLRTGVRRLEAAQTRESIERSTVETVTELPTVDFAWLGGEMPEGGQLRASAHSGPHQSYLDGIVTDLSDETATEPAVTAARTGERSLVTDVASTRSDAGTWQQRALRDGFQSVLAVPLSSEGVVAGVLALYSTDPSALGGTVADVVGILANRVAAATSALYCRQSLLATRETELSVDFRDESLPLLGLARGSECTVVVTGITPQSGAPPTQHVAITDGATTDFLAYAATSPLVERVDRDDETIQLQCSGRSIVQSLAAHGFAIRETVATPTHLRLSVGLPPTMTARGAMGVVTELQPDAELVSKREQHSPSADPNTESRVTDVLTDRQQEVLALAYEQGYFESPKQVTGDELADDLGISSTAVNEHLRAAQRNLFDGVLDDT